MADVFEILDGTSDPGSHVGLAIDTTNIRVYADGYLVRISTNDVSSAIYASIYDPTYSYQWFYLESRLYIGATSYLYAEGGYELRTTEVIENTPSRITIRITGKHQTATAGAPNEDLCITTLYFYPDRIAFDVSIVNETSGIVLDNSLNNEVFYIYGAAATLTNEANIHESSGSEVTPSGYAASTGDYVGFTSDEVDVFMIMTDSTDSAQQFFKGAGQVTLRWNNQTLAASTDHYIRGVVIVDSSERDYGNKKYSSVERLEMGDQYKDTTLDDPSTGSWVTDLVIPENIGVDGFTADGAHHVDHSSDVVKVTWDTDRHNPNVVMHYLGFYTGSIGSETDHLLEHNTFNEELNIGSTITALTGNNANWEDSSGTNRNVSNDEISTHINRDGGLDTKDLYHADCATTAYDNDFFKQGAFILKFTPQFGYDDADDQTLFVCYVDSDDYIKLVYDAGNDCYELRVSWGGTLTTISDDAYTVNRDLQHLTVLHASWDSERDYLMLSKNGTVVAYGSNTGTPSTSGASYVHVGADSDGDGTTSLNSDIYIDEYKAFDGCMLPYGGGIFTGNGEVDTELADKEIIFFWDCESSGASSSIIPNDKTITLNDAATLSESAALLGTYGLDTGGTVQDYATVSIVDSDILDPKKGSIQFWINLHTSVVNYSPIISFGDADDYISFQTGAGVWRFIYRSQSTTESLNGTESINAGEWYHIRATWQDSDPNNTVYLYVNGKMEARTTIANPWDGLTSGTLYFGAFYDSNNGHDCYIDQIYITNNPYTPDCWSVYGEPLHYSLLEVG